MHYFIVTICFDGTRYHGWQIQKNAVTVQEIFQQALFSVIGESVDIKGCSRTDTGVHARAFCISFGTGKEIRAENLLRALNQRLPSDVAVKSAAECGPGFHARYSCLGKEYVYRLYNGRVRDPFEERYSCFYPYPLEEQRLDRAAQAFVGTHDFAAFCSIRGDVEDTVRTVSSFHVERRGDMVLFTVAADGFLYHMVRIMVGTLLKIAQGKIPDDGIPAILESGDRNRAGHTAQPQGLFLNRVFYPEQE